MLHHISFRLGGWLDCSIIKNIVISWHLFRCIKALATLASRIYGNVQLLLKPLNLPITGWDSWILKMEVRQLLISIDIIYTVCVIESSKSLKRKPQRVVQTLSSLCETSFDESHRYVMSKLLVTGADLQTMSSYELKFPLIVVLQSRGDDVTDVTEISGWFQWQLCVHGLRRWIVRSIFQSICRELSQKI